LPGIGCYRDEFVIWSNGRNRPHACYHVESGNSPNVIRELLQRLFPTIDKDAGKRFVTYQREHGLGGFREAILIKNQRIERGPGGRVSVRCTGEIEAESAQRPAEVGPISIEEVLQLSGRRALYE